jgi:hypothetical protein
MPVCCIRADRISTSATLHKNKIMESEIRWAVLEVECFFVKTKTTLPTQNGEAQQTEKKHGGSLIRVICRAKGES